jgi:N-acyl-D-amino-acid deacylase
MNYDLIISGGTIVDGTGAAPYKGDVAIRDGKIAKMGDLNEDSAAKTIDATGQTVTPGFVDLHTHLDAQVGGTPSSHRVHITA